jgi:hypothetical protein
MSLPPAPIGATGFASDDVSPHVSPDAFPDVSSDVSGDMPEDVEISLDAPQYAGLTSREQLEHVTEVLYNWVLTQFYNKTVQGDVLCPESPFHDFIFIPIPVVTPTANIVVQVMVPETFVAGHAVFRLRYAEVLPGSPDVLLYSLDLTCKLHGLPDLNPDLMYHRLDDLVDGLFRVLDYASGDPDLDSESDYDSN